MFFFGIVLIITGVIVLRYLMGTLQKKSEEQFWDTTGIVRLYILGLASFIYGLVLIIKECTEYFRNL